AVRRRRAQRRHHGRQSQPGPRAGPVAGRRGADRRRRAASPGADDGGSGDRRHAAGGAGDRRRQRCPTQSCDGSCRGTYSGYVAHAVHRSDILFRAGAMGAAAGRARGNGGWDRRGGLERKGAGTGMMRRELQGAAIALIGALLTQCAVGPDFAPPAAPDVTRYTPEPLAKSTASAATAGGGAQRFAGDLDLPGQWWTLFHSKDLNSLVEKSLAANQDLKAAQAALTVAKQNVYAQRGALFPTLDANYTASRQVAPISEPSDFGAGSPTFNLFTAQLNVAYAPDVFGGVRRSIESLEAQADSQRFALEATYLTLTSNLAGAAVQEASLRGQIAATQTIIKFETDVLGVMRHQRELGDIA